MSLHYSKFLFIDCQTTGMHPSLGELLEISWWFGELSLSTVDLGDEQNYKSRLIQVESIPRRVSEVTGIYQHDLVHSLPAEKVREEFLLDVQNALNENDGQLCAVIHYAQFEKAWLLDFLDVESLPFKVLCTHAIAKRLLPTVPSRNIRALSGYFGKHFGDVKRSAEHLAATIHIWKSLVAELAKSEIRDLTALEAWLQNVKAKKPVKYDYNIDREWRLKLPSSPGVYRMFAKNGEILYVGKATSLKDRVNSYFRGVKGREKRKLEMMTQAWKIEVTECGSALEAALLETDEIKKHNPPYNVALKSGNKKLSFYSRDFSLKSQRRDDDHTIGPFRTVNAVDDLKVIQRWAKDGDARGVFYDLLSAEELVSGYEEFRRRWPQVDVCAGLRDHLALGFKILREQRGEDLPKMDESIEQALVTDEDESLKLEIQEAQEAAELAEEEIELSPEEVADKFERAYMRAANSLLRACRMTRLLNGRVEWIEKGECKSLFVSNGKIVRREENVLPSEFIESHTPFSTRAWQNLGVEDYDRMSVLLTALSHSK